MNINENSAVYIIIYPNGSMMTTLHRPEKEHYQKGAKFFFADGDKISLNDINVLMAENWIPQYIQAYPIKQI